VATKAGASLGLLDRDPFGFRPPRGWFATGALEAPEKPRHHSADQISAVLHRAAREARSGDWVAVRLWALVSVYALLGLRAREALGLRTADVDLLEGLIWVRPNDRRALKTTASRRRLAAPKALIEPLSAWRPLCGSDWFFPHKYGTGPWFHGRPGHKPLDQVKALGARSGVSGLTILSLRHTVGTLAEGWGLGDLQLQRLLGHRRPRTQLSYRHEDLGQLRTTAELVRY